MAIYYTTGYTGFTSTLQSNSPWSRAGANDCSCNGSVATVDGGGERTYRITTSPGSADGSCQLIYADNDGDSQGGPLIRASDINNWYWGLRNSNAGQWEIRQCNGGTESTLSAVFEGGQTSPFTLKITVSTGQALELFSGGVSKTTATGTRSGTSGEAGFRVVGGGSNTIDDFQAEDSTGGATGHPAVRRFGGIKHFPRVIGPTGVQVWSGILFAMAASGLTMRHKETIHG